MAQDAPTDQQEHKDFFISYTTSDQQWAEWIAMQLEHAGYTLIIEAWDFRPGSNLILEMDRAASTAERTLPVISPDYLKAELAFAQWAAAFYHDPTGAQRQLLPVRVQPCEVSGLLKSIVSIDLVGLDEAQARTRLLIGVQQGRAKPTTVAFPGKTTASALFPGTTPIHQQSQKQPLEQEGTLPSARYHSCFLSYAHQDEPLAQRLYSDLQTQGVQCWSAAHNMKIGAKIRPTIDEAIQRQEKILILLSQHSINSAWVEDEVEAAFEYEQREQREMLFPVRLDNAVMETSQAWAAKLRRTRHIGDFTNWTEPGAYQRAFERLLRDLEKEDRQPLDTQPHTRLFLPDLEEVDNLVMKSLCELALAGESYWVNVEQLPAKAKATGIEWDQFLEAMKVLEQHGFLEITEADGGHIVLLKLRTQAFEKYVQAYISKYQELKITFINQMLQTGTRSSKDLASQLHQPLMLCNHILHHQAELGFVKITEMGGNTILVQDISAELSRAFTNNIIEAFLKKQRT